MKRLTYLLVSGLLMIGLVIGACGCGSSGDDSESAASLSDAASTEAEANTTSLDHFMGGWATSDDRNGSNIVAFGEESGMIRVEFAGIPGGGYYIMFNPDDITFDGDTMTCVNGVATTDGPDATDVTLTAIPYDGVPGDYQFQLASETLGLENDIQNTYHYTKVTDTADELDDWIDQNYSFD